MPTLNARPKPIGPAEHIVAVGADAEVDEQESGDDARVAQEQTVVAEGVGEGQGGGHEDGHDKAGDEPERQNDFLHIEEGLGMRAFCVGDADRASPVRVILAESAKNHPFRR
jgi:hypothetical protein